MTVKDSSNNRRRGEKYPIRSIRLDEEVYQALRSVAAVSGSPNKALRQLLVAKVPLDRLVHKREV